MLFAKPHKLPSISTDGQDGVRIHHGFSHGETVMQTSSTSEPLMEVLRQVAFFSLGGFSATTLCQFVSFCIII